MARGNRSLKRIGSHTAAEPLRAIEGREAPANQHAIPARAVLVEQQDGLSGRPYAGRRARRLDLHQRDEPVDFRFIGDEPGQHASEAERVLAERRPEPVLSGRG